jgi:hypothetical protein
MEKISQTEKIRLWKKEAEYFSEKLKQMDIEDEKKLSKIEKIMSECNKQNISVFTLLHYTDDLFTGENSVSQWQYENMLLLLKEQQLELLQNSLEKDKEFLRFLKSRDRE